MIQLKESIKKLWSLNFYVLPKEVTHHDFKRTTNGVTDVHDESLFNVVIDLVNVVRVSCKRQDTLREHQVVHVLNH